MSFKKWMRQLFCGEHIYKVISEEPLRRVTRTKYIFDVEIDSQIFDVYALTKQCVKCEKTIVEEKYIEKE